jgi:hypothetical protein
MQFNQPITNKEFAKAILDLPLSTCRQEKSRLENSIQHLERSNREMEDELDKLDADEQQAFKQFIQENVNVIANQRSRTELLQERIQLEEGPPGSKNKSKGENEDQGIYL